MRTLLHTPEPRNVSRTLFCCSKMHVFEEMGFIYQKENALHGELGSTRKNEHLI
jgi:hypothetical protein